MTAAMAVGAGAAFERRGRALIVGAGGGVGHAVLAVLTSTDAGRRLARRFEELLLLDAAAHGGEVRPANARWLSPRRVSSAEDLVRLAREHRIDEIVDLSSLGTLDCIARCDAAGVKYLTSSVEHWPEQPPARWEDLILAVLHRRSSRFFRTSHLVGSGMNPGIVNALVFRGIHAFAQIAGVPASADALRLASILVTEEDTTEDLAGPRAPDTFSMSWSPRHCLEELLQPAAVAVREGESRALGHSPHEASYRARCGDRLIDGMVVPHEEVITLGERFRGVEIAFVYRIPDAARRALEANPDRTAAEWAVHRMYPPHADELRGRDRVGVLLGSRRFGELWIGYDVDVRDGLRIGTSATQLQVAAGVVAGWSQLGRVRGIHFVEALDWRELLAVVDSILGSPAIVHDADAPARSLTERRVRVADRSRRERAPVVYTIGEAHSP